MDRVIQQILGMVLRKGARQMIRQASKRGQDDGGASKGPDQSRSLKRAEQALRAGRKIGRV